MKKKYKVLFSPNGSTAVFDDDGQVPDLQKPWIELFAEFIESKDLDLAEFDIQMPNGVKVELFETPTGWNWRSK